MKLHKYIIACLLPCFFSPAVFSKDSVELDTTIIKGNKESPAILYIVPWKEIRVTNDEYQGLIIDDLQSEIISPVFPASELLVK